MNLDIVHHVKNLRNIFDSKMKFNFHIDKCINRLLGFIQRCCKHFNSISTMRTHYLT